MAGPTDPTRTRWRTGDGPGPVTSPTVVGERHVFVTTPWRLFAFRRSDGDRRSGWTRRIEERDDTASPSGALAYHRGTVYYGRSGGTVAVSARNGAEEWSRDVPTYRPPAVRDGTLYLAGGADGQTVAALDATDGTERWSRAVEGLASAPAVTDAAVHVITGDGTVRALDRRTGDTLWTTPLAATPEHVPGPPAVADGTLFVGAATADAGSGRLYALDTADGTDRWLFETESDGVFRTSPAVADGTVYAGSESGTLYALGADSGRPRWQSALVNRFGTPQPLHAGPVVAGGTAYAVDHLGRLSAVDVETGERRWRRRVTPGRRWAAPALVDGALYYGGDGATLFTFRDD